MDKWIKDISAWKDYGLIVLAIALFTGFVAPMFIIKWGILAWVAANLWPRWNSKSEKL